MRLTTVLLVSALLVLAGVVYADDACTTTTTTTPTGAGPTMEPTTDTTSASTTTTTTTTTTTPTPPPWPAGTTMAPMSPEVEQLNTNLVSSTFGVDSTSVAALRAAGWSWGDINLIANIANKSGQSLFSVATLRSQGLSWSDIGSRFNIASVDLTSPTIVRTRVAGFTTEYGYMPLYYRSDIYGNPVLTRWDARTFSKMGYKWNDIAVAANVSAQTGVPVRDVLALTDRGYTWFQIAKMYNLDPASITNVSRYPFAGPGVMTTTTTTSTYSTRGTVETAPPAGSGPMSPPVPNY